MITQDYPSCFFCDQKKVKLKVQNPLGNPLQDIYSIDCPYCSPYQITDEAAESLKELNFDNRAKLAAYNCHFSLKEPGKRLTYYRDKPQKIAENIRVIADIIKYWWPLRLRDRLDIALLNINQKIGSKLRHDLSVASEQFPLCLANDWQGSFFMLDRLQEAGWIKIINPQRG